VVIRLVAASKGLVEVKPDPAHVRLGDSVTWELFGQPGTETDAIDWEIYFRSGNPFNSLKRGAWKGSTKSVGTGGHQGAVTAGSANQMGDWKYGVKLVNANTGIEMSDDDPRLIVSA